MKLKCAQQTSAPIKAEYLFKEILTSNILADNIDFLELQAQLSTGRVKYQDCTEEDFRKKPSLVSMSLVNLVSQHVTAKHINKTIFHTGKAIK